MRYIIKILNENNDDESVFSENYIHFRKGKFYLGTNDFPTSFTMDAIKNDKELREYLDGKQYLIEECEEYLEKIHILKYKYSIYKG